ncbi:DUF885 domain-containing protein [Dyella caseinilytica]|uniref:DUF885 domain-containing protein n=1 Tax=Dyella caseinilytica TaxID=1849581 RepID=A0ABX7GRC7_9GAMM|nr:DUF885 domain-containing protein [Dyella caseinilytica]QRN52984.1 DUF885 domain-containing protein [Dyella caseinilytica]GGA10567.1 hypothetical protein GCM10011408_34820 [Dyella caseinilytica]
MTKRLALAAAIALAAAGSTHAQTTPAPAWIARSNADAQVLLNAQAQFNPENATSLGLPGYDDKVIDLKPNVEARQNAAVGAARAKLQGMLATEKDSNVRQDLQIMIHAADLQIEGTDLTRKYMLPYIDIGQQIFNGEFYLLKDQVDDKHRASALKRLQCYVGQAPGCTPITQQAEALTTSRLSEKNLLGPYKGSVDQQLSNTQQYVDGVRQLFTKYKLDDAQSKAALDAMEAQLKQYDAWVHSTIVPRQRDDFRLPEPLYAFNLKQVGIDIPPEDLIKQAQLEFVEVRSAMQMMTPEVARAEGFQATDYRDVIKALKKQQLGKDDVVPWYHEVIGKIEDIIRSEHLVTLPQREMQMRLASQAETANVPAPHMDPPPLINNHGERGTFVLTMGNPSSNGGNSDTAYDDFTFKAAAWTLTAHEGRPGHELQFSAMVERGVSLARSIFAFNSVNVEGWALYSEAEMLPYEPPAGQFTTLQFRLVRAARAFLDPMLNLGLISKERAHDVLRYDVGLSEAMTREELDRYTFNSPGQATAYFYGYMRLQQLRLQTELALGKDFNHQAFNDFIIGQGLLPPEQLAEAVRTQFIPSQQKH